MVNYNEYEIYTRIIEHASILYGGNKENSNNNRRSRQLVENEEDEPYAIQTRMMKK